MWKNIFGDDFIQKFFFGMFRCLFFLDCDGIRKNDISQYLIENWLIIRSQIHSIEFGQEFDPTQFEIPNTPAAWFWLAKQKQLKISLNLEENLFEDSQMDTFLKFQISLSVHAVETSTHSFASSHNDCL